MFDFFNFSLLFKLFQRDSEILFWNLRYTSQPVNVGAFLVAEVRHYQRFCFLDKKLFLSHLVQKIEPTNLNSSHFDVSSFQKLITGTCNQSYWSKWCSLLVILFHRRQVIFRY